MYIQITEAMFIEQFCIMDRMDNFSIDGLRALFEHYENLEEDTGESIECDVIAICCEWSEESVEDIIENYSLQDAVEDCEDDEDKLEEVVEALNNETFAIALGDGKILYQAF